MKTVVAVAVAVVVVVVTVVNFAPLVLVAVAAVTIAFNCPLPSRVAAAVVLPERPDLCLDVLAALHRHLDGPDVPDLHLRLQLLRHHRIAPFARVGPVQGLVGPRVRVSAGARANERA